MWVVSRSSLEQFDDASVCRCLLMIDRDPEQNGPQEQLLALASEQSFDEIVAGALPRDGIGDDDGIGIAGWPPVGTHVDDCRGQRVVKQHVPAEVSMNQLTREINGSPTSKQPLHRLRELGVDLPPGHPVGDGPSMRRHDRRGPCDARDSSVEVLRCIENLVPRSAGVVPFHPLPCHPARDNPVSGHRTDGLDDADGRSGVQSVERLSQPHGLRRLSRWLQHQYTGPERLPLAAFERLGRLDRPCLQRRPRRHPCRLRVHGRPWCRSRVQSVDDPGLGEPQEQRAGRIVRRVADRAIGDTLAW